MEFIVNSKIIISSTIEDLSDTFAKLIIDGIGKCEGYFYLALSGGSTPKFIFEYLVENYKTKINWNKLRLFWGDERCVPPDNADSNYKMAYDSLISKINIPQENIFRIKGELKPDEEVKNYSHIISEKVPFHSGFPQFDLIMLGLGEDGHTASIFPGNQNLFHVKDICAVTEHPVTKQKRITITGEVINNTKLIVFLVVGENKKNIIDDILNWKNDFKKFPASYIDPHNGKLIWLIDKNAGRLLTH
jgi:6-phosphogluconolactonase